MVTRIEALLKERKISKSKFLSDLNLGVRTLSNWRDRGTIPSGAVLQKIADYFDVSIDYLLGKETQKEKSPSGIPDRLLKELSENPAKLELALLICDWDDDKLDRALKLLDASLLLPKEDQPS